MKNDGKSAEHLVQDALKLLEKKHKATWVRLYDSTSAGYGKGGSLIPQQPGDFIFTMEGKFALLEVKSSNRYACLAEGTMQSIFSENQILGARLWRRSGARAFCLYHYTTTGRSELWDMAWVIDAFLAPPRQRKLKGVPLFTGENIYDMLYNAMI